MKTKRPAPWDFRIVEKFLIIPRTLRFWPLDLDGEPKFIHELNFPEQDAPRERRWLERAMVIQWRVMGYWRSMFWYETGPRPPQHPNCKCVIVPVDDDDTKPYPPGGGA
jgi:hypothetical protein